MKTANRDGHELWRRRSTATHDMRTLVLVDGRRLAFHPAEAENGDEFVDLNMSPARRHRSGRGAQQWSVGDLRVRWGGRRGQHHPHSNPTTTAGRSAAATAGATGRGHYRERSAYVARGASTDKTSITVSFKYAQSDPLYLSAHRNT